MNSEEIRQSYLKKLEELKSLDLPEGQYLIWGSGPLAIRGLREARDVDVVVRAPLWKELIQKYPVQGKKQNLITLGDIEVWSDLLDLTAIIDTMIAQCDWIEGFPFMNLKYMVEWKRHLGREKDLQDIALIEEYLGEIYPRKLKNQ